MSIDWLIVKMIIPVEEYTEYRKAQSSIRSCISLSARPLFRFRAVTQTQKCIFLCFQISLECLFSALSPHRIFSKFCTAILCSLETLSCIKPVQVCSVELSVARQDSSMDQNFYNERSRIMQYPSDDHFSIVHTTLESLLPRQQQNLVKLYAMQPSSRRCDIQH